MTSIKKINNLESSDSTFRREKMTLKIGKYKVSKRDSVLDLHDTENNTPNTLTVGGGYDATGVSISSAGVYQGNGAMTNDGAVTFESTLQVDGAATIDGLITGGAAITVTAGNATLTNGDLVITAADHGIIHTNSGTVTQATNHATAVTLNTTSGVIQLAAVALAATTNAEFTVTNSTVQADSVILLTVQDENTTNNAQLAATVHTIAGGSFKISLVNPHSSGATSATASKIHFLVINNS